MRRAEDRGGLFAWKGVAAVAAGLGLCSSCTSPPADPPAPAFAAPSAGAPAGDAEASGPADATGWGTPTDKDENEEEPSFVHGSLSMRFRERSQGSETDRDLYALLDLEMGDTEQDPWTATIVGRLSRQFGDDDGVFAGPESTFDSDLTAQLYEAHFDIRDVPSIEVVSMGRLELAETPVWARYDGLQMVTEPGGSGRQVYGFYLGQTVHFWESSPEGDGIFGAWWVDHPWSGGRARLDWMHVEDETITGARDDDLLAAQLRQSVGKSTQLQGDYSRLGGSSRDWRFAGSWNGSESDVFVKGSYYELLSKQFELTEELDPLSPTLFAQYPYRQMQLLATKSWEDFDLDGGTDFRRVTDESDVSDFNRDFERYYVTGTKHGLFADDLSLGLTGEIWDSGDTRETAWGVDATWEWSAVRASLGTWYALYKNDFFDGEEHDDVRTWYALLRWLTAARTTWTLGYDYEDTSEGNFHTFRLGAIWRF